jgi:hypothetical protein
MLTTPRKEAMGGAEMCGGGRPIPLRLGHCSEGEMRPGLRGPVRVRGKRVQRTVQMRRGLWQGAAGARDTPQGPLRNTDPNPLLGVQGGG